MTMHPKMNVLTFLIYAQKGQFKRIKSSLTILFSSLLFSSLHLLFPQKHVIENLLYQHFLPWALAFFYYNTSFASPTAKVITPC
jgi:hypothetical protein